MYKDEIEEMNNYLLHFKQLEKSYPDLAKRRAVDNLQKSGILDKNQELASPYNEKKIHDDNFLRGPQKIYFEDDER